MTPDQSNTRPPDLPDFTAPPLTEVVLGVQFSELRGYRTVHGGLLWNSEYRAFFPYFEERPPIRPIFETFGAAPATESRLNIELRQQPDIPRLLFYNESGNELVQVQSDRFMHNWRKVDDNTEYPHYEYIRNIFHENILSFQRFLKKENLGEIDPNQIEITYVNYIDMPEHETAKDFLFRVFSGISSESLSDFETDIVLVDAEEMQFSQRYALRDTATDPFWGRLHVHARPTQTAEGVACVRLDLTARGQPKDATISGVLDRLDTARKAIVNVFCNITTSEMHEQWGRKS